MTHYYYLFCLFILLLNTVYSKDFDSRVLTRISSTPILLDSLFDKKLTEKMDSFNKCLEFNLSENYDCVIVPRGNMTDVVIEKQIGFEDAASLKRFQIQSSDIVLISIFHSSTNSLRVFLFDPTKNSLVKKPLVLKVKRADFDAIKAAKKMSKLISEHIGFDEKHSELDLLSYNLNRSVIFYKSVSHLRINQSVGDELFALTENLLHEITDNRSALNLANNRKDNLSISLQNSIDVMIEFTAINENNFIISVIDTVTASLINSRSFNKENINKGTLESFLQESYYKLDYTSELINDPSSLENEARFYLNRISRLASFQLRPEQESFVALILGQAALGVSVDDEELLLESLHLILKNLYPPVSLKNFSTLYPNYSDNWNQKFPARYEVFQQLVYEYIGPYIEVLTLNNYESIYSSLAYCAILSDFAGQLKIIENLPEDLKGDFLSIHLVSLFNLGLYEECISLNPRLSHINHMGIVAYYESLKFLNREREAYERVSSWMWKLNSNEDLIASVLKDSQKFEGVDKTIFLWNNSIKGWYKDHPVIITALYESLVEANELSFANNILADFLLRCKNKRSSASLFIKNTEGNYLSRFNQRIKAAKIIHGSSLNPLPNSIIEYYLDETIDKNKILPALELVADFYGCEYRVFDKAVSLKNFESYQEINSLIEYKDALKEIEKNYLFGDSTGVIDRVFITSEKLGYGRNSIIYRGYLNSINIASTYYLNKFKRFDRRSMELKMAIMLANNPHVIPTLKNQLPDFSKKVIITQPSVFANNGKFVFNDFELTVGKSFESAYKKLDESYLQMSFQNAISRHDEPLLVQ